MWYLNIVILKFGAVQSFHTKKYSYEKRTLEYLRKNKQSMVSQIKKNPIRVGVVSVM
jgi:hypothetical protein